MADKPQAYEKVPFRMCLPAAPMPAPEVLEAGRLPTEMSIVGLEGRPAQMEAARHQANELLRRCRHEHRAGDRSAVLDLVRDHPEFVVMDPWARETLLESRLLRKKSGRPRSSFSRHPLIVVGLVSHLVDTGAVPNKERAFARLEELGFGPYESLKSAYYQALREPRFRAVLVEYPELAERLSADEGERLVAGVRVLGPGEEVTYHGEHPILGTVEMTFKDLGEGT